MVERVARGKLVVPALATLSLIAGSMAGADGVAAASRDTTLQIRVQVVESCQIRVSNVGRLAHSCDGVSTGTSPSPLPIDDIIDSARERLAAIRPFPQPVGRSTDVLSSQTHLDTTSRVDGANQRARDLAQRIAQRVHYITIAY